MRIFGYENFPEFAISVGNESQLLLDLLNILDSELSALAFCCVPVRVRLFRK
mgnify:CR=1 FL=1